MSTLYIVATPIGNMKDITLRALEVFKSVKLIACEDTRVSRKLLVHYEIDTPLVAYHQHSTDASLKKILTELESGNDVAYISDAGTPGIQDPGNKLVHDVLQKNDSVTMVPIPGASAVIALASVSGIPTDSLLFMGFIPKKKGRQKSFAEITESKRAVVFYESGHRILKTLAELAEALGTSRQVVVGRELTKRFETIYRGSINEVEEQLKHSSQKGEFVVIIEGR